MYWSTRDTRAKYSLAYITYHYGRGDVIEGYTSTRRISELLAHRWMPIMNDEIVPPLFARYSLPLFNKQEDVLHWTRPVSPPTLLAEH